MNISLTVKTQNMCSFNLSNKDSFFKNKVKAATLGHPSPNQYPGWKQIKHTDKRI